MIAFQIKKTASLKEAVGQCDGWRGADAGALTLLQLASPQEAPL